MWEKAIETSDCLSKEELEEEMTKFIIEKHENYITDVAHGITNQWKEARELGIDITTDEFLEEYCEVENVTVGYIRSILTINFKI